MTRGPRSTQDRFDRLLADRPAVLAALDEVHAAAWATVDGELLEMCRLRIAMLLGHRDTLTDPDVDPALVADLPRYPNSPRFSPVQRACLAFTEQFVIDVASMDDATVAAVREPLGPDGLLEFTNALLVVEQRIRLALMWTGLFGEVDR